MLKNTELDYVSHARKSILTSTNPSARTTYKSLELTTATRLPTVIHHTPKFCNVI